MKARTSLIHIVWLLAAVALWQGCKEGQPVGNTAPETWLFLDGVDLRGENRLNSVVRLHWYGEDRDGYVAGYELSFDQLTWNLVKAQDSTFRFDLTSGADTADILFWVRAIDNDGEKDPSPAFLRIPIRNTPPYARFETVKPIPDTVQLVFSLLWQAGDLDGDATLDSVFIKLNDGAWFALNRQTTFVSFVPTEPAATGIQPAQVYAGSATSPLPRNIEGLNLNGINRVYLRARDIAGSYSPTDSSKLFFVKRRAHDLLVVDDHGATVAPPETDYLPALRDATSGFDYFELQKNLPPFWDPAFFLYLRLYDRIFWYSDGNQYAQFGQQQLLDVAANAIQRYLNGGGKILISTRFPTNFPEGSPVFGFSPIDSLSTSTGQARIAVDSLAKPLEAGYPVLACSQFVTGVDPFYLKPTAIPLYKAGLTATGGWRGPATVCAKTNFANGRTNMVFWSVELHKLNKNPQALREFFDQVLNREFNW